MDIIQIVATLIQAAVLLLLLIQVRIMHLDWKRANIDSAALHERTKKQSTLEHAGELWAEARYELESKFGSEVIATDEAENIFKDKELKAHVDKLLGTLEHIAAGVNMGIYDADILYRMCASSVMNNFTKFKNYIKIRRQQESEEMYIAPMIQTHIRTNENYKIVQPLKNRQNNSSFIYRLRIIA